MLNFKEQLKKDMSVFFNLDELADEVDIDGEKIPVVFDEQKLEDYKIKNAGVIETDRDGLSSQRVLFYVQKKDLPSKPYIGKHMKFDKKFYRIEDIPGEDELTYTIVLVGHRS